MAAACASSGASASSGSSSTSGSRMRERIRPRHSLRAIVAIQASSSPGTVPESRLPYAERNVCCAASSASSGSRSIERQMPSTSRACRSKSDGDARGGRPVAASAR